MCRQLETGPMDGATNMALDEAIFLLGGSVPALRLYSWSAPCLSIGYSQQVTRDVDLGACRRLGIGLVRRPTGGGAILHDREVTYSLIAPAAHPAVSGTVAESYGKVALGLVAGLASLGLKVKMAPASGDYPGNDSACFSRPSAHELTVGGRKIAGSAQCRRQGRLLQHGSLLLDLDPGPSIEVLRPPEGKDVASRDEDFRRRATSLREALGRPVCFEEVSRALARGLKEVLGLELERDDPSPEEWDLARKLRQEKYNSDAWNLAR